MTEESGKVELGLNDLSEDLFGLSVRAFHTVKTMITNPKTAFAAARDPDWNMRQFTPSIRLVFSLLALTVAARLFWAGPNSFMGESTVQQLLASGQITEIRIAKLVAEQIIDVFLICFPFCFLILHALMAVLLRIWGPASSYILRLRLHFMALVPSTLFTFVTLPFFSNSSTSAYYTAVMVTIPMGFLIDFSTVFRGGVYGIKRSTRIVKASLFSLMAFITSMACNVLGFTIASTSVGVMHAIRTGAIG